MKAQRVILFAPIFGIVLIFSLFFGVFQAVATERERITPENVDRLVEIASIGRGIVEQILWTADSQNIIVGTRDGFSIYHGGDMNTDPIQIELGAFFRYSTSSDGKYVLGRPFWPRFKFDPLDFRVWEVDTGRPILSSLDQYTGEPLLTRFTDVSFLRDSSGIQLHIPPQKIYHIKFDQLDTIALVQEPDIPHAFSATVSKDGRLAARCERGGSVDIWDVDSRSIIATFQVIDAGRIRLGESCAMFNNDSTQVATFFQYSDRPQGDTTYSVVVVWSIETNRPLFKRRLPYDSVIGFDVDNTPIVITKATSPTNQYEDVVSLIELDTDTVRWEIVGNNGFDTGEFNFEQGVFVGDRWGSQDSTLTAWDLATGTVLWSQYLPQANYWDVSPIGERLIIGRSLGTDAQGWRQNDTMISTIDLYSGRQLSTTTAHMNHIYDPVFSPSSRYIVIGDVDDGFRVWDTVTWDIREDFEEVNFPMPRLSFRNPIFINQDSFYGEIHSSNGTNETGIWNVETGQLVDMSPQGIPYPSTIAMNPHGRIAAGVTHETHDTTISIVTIVDRDANAEVLSTTSESFVLFVRISRDDSMIAFPTVDQKIHLWDINSAEERYILDVQHESEYTDILDVAFSPNQQWLVVSYDGGRQEMWNLETGDYWGDADAIEFNPNIEAFAAICLTDFELRFYDVESGAALRNHPTIPNSTAMSFSPDGQLLAVQTHGEIDWYGEALEGEIWIYDVVNGNRLAQINDHFVLTNPIFSPDGTMLIAQADGRRMIVYGIEPN